MTVGLFRRTYPELRDTHVLKILRECEETNTWPAQYTEETDLMIPAFALTEQSDLTEFAEVESD